MQSFCIEVGQTHLEFSERLSGMAKNREIVALVVRDRADKVADTPAIAVFGIYVVLSVRCMVKMKGCLIDPGGIAEVSRHGIDVFHHRFRVLEHVRIHLLKKIVFLYAVRTEIGDFIGRIDIPVVDRRVGGRLPAQRKLLSQFGKERKHGVHKNSCIFTT